MSNKIGLFSALFTFLFCAVFAQVSSAVDTIFHIPQEQPIQLTHSFILESSVLVYQDNKLIPARSIQSIEGSLTLSKPNTNSPIIVKYDYLTNGLPRSVGPKWKTLPPFNLDQSQTHSSTEQIYASNFDKESALFSSGNIYRQLTVSPLGGSDFSGGLQMQLNGKLAKNLRVSGVLTDQDLPIQPEGTTRELEELDRVYLTVTHPDYSVNAGDIIFESDLSNKQKISRKLVGLKNNFKMNEWSGSGVYAGSKGQ